MRIRVRIKSDDQGEDQMRIRVMKVRTRVDQSVDWEDQVRIVSGRVRVGSK